MFKNLFAGLVALSLLTTGTSVCAENNNRIVAEVNNKVILQSDLDDYFRAYQRRLRDNIPESEMPDEITIKKAALNDLIHTSLVEQLAEKMGLSINDMQLDQIMENAARMNNTTVQRIYETSFQKEGLTPLQTREKFRKEAMISELQQINVRRRIHISNQEIDQLVETMKEGEDAESTFKIADIFIRLPDQPTTEDEKKAEQHAQNIADAARKGENFAKLATKYNQGTTYNENRGFVSVNELPAEFTSSLTGAKAGDIIGPVRMDAGFAVIKVIATQGAEYTPDIKVHSRHILIKPTIILSDDRVKAQLNSIRNDILNGTVSFADEARKYSDDPSSAVHGGDLPMTSPDIFDPLFARTLLSLKEGEISQPFKSSFGWHIVQLLEKKIDKASNRSLKERAYQRLFARRFNDELILWFNDLENNSYVKILDPALRRDTVQNDNAY